MDDKNAPHDVLTGLTGQRIAAIERVDEQLISIVMEDGEHIGFLAELRQDRLDTAARLRLERGTVQMVQQQRMELS